MRRLLWFVSGLLVGGALIHFAMNFHLIRSAEGVHLVPKVQAQFTDTYADVREYALADWAKHNNLTVALLLANRRDLMHASIASTADIVFDR